MAFWAYSGDRPLLYGEVVSGPNSEGRVQIRSLAVHRPNGTYGGGWVTPLFLLPMDKGTALALQMDRLDTERATAVHAAQEAYRAGLGAVLPPGVAKQLGLPTKAKREPK